MSRSGQAALKLFFERRLKVSPVAMRANGTSEREACDGNAHGDEPGAREDVMRGDFRYVLTCPCGELHAEPSVVAGDALQVVEEGNLPEAARV